MGTAVRILAPARIRLAVVPLGEAGVRVRRVGPRPVRVGEVTAQAVVGIVGDAVQLAHVQRGVGKGPVDDAPVALLAVGAEAEIVGAPDRRVG